MRVFGVMVMIVVVMMSVRVGMIVGALGLQAAKTCAEGVAEFAVGDV